MANTYRNCTNLTTAVCGPNVQYLYYTYYGCTNIAGNVYFYTNTLYGQGCCFLGRSNSKQLNIYVHENTLAKNNLL
jgi:hypothetical protein